jgi:hypothetical protein
VLRLLSEKKLTEVFVHRHDNATLGQSPVENRPIAGISATLSYLCDIVAQFTKARGDAHASGTDR